MKKIQQTQPSELLKSSIELQQRKLIEQATQSLTEQIQKAVKQSFNLEAKS